MELNVIWSNSSQKEYIKTLSYIYEQFGLKAAANLRTEVNTWVSRIAKNPEIAAPEEFLKEEKHLYRSRIVGKHNKIVYRHDEENIYISDFWDMRMEPTKLSKRVKKK